MRETRAKVMISFFQMLWTLVGGSLQVAEEGAKEKHLFMDCFLLIYKKKKKDSMHPLAMSEINLRTARSETKHSEEVKV